MAFRVTCFAPVAEIPRANVLFWHGFHWLSPCKSWISALVGVVHCGCRIGWNGRVWSTRHRWTDLFTRVEEFRPTGVWLTSRGTPITIPIVTAGSYVDRMIGSCSDFGISVW